jgi:uncharacterized protein with GYD domain
MPKYISLLRYTEKGARAIQDSPKRAQSFAKAAARAGVKVEAQYWSVGAYDGILILSAATAEQALHCVSELAAAGNVRTETLQLFGAEEFAAIVNG